MLLNIFDMLHILVNPCEVINVELLFLTINYCFSKRLVKRLQEREVLDMLIESIDSLIICLERLR